MNNQTAFYKLIHWIKNSITARLLMMMFLTLALFIPLLMIQELIKERKERHESVVHEINEKWGTEILIYGPVLKVPYHTYTEQIVIDKATKSQNTIKTEKIEYAYFFPETLHFDTHAKTELKKRNIFQTTVFDADIKMTGSFSLPDFSSKSIAPEDIVWDEASILFQTSNLKGIKKEVAITLNNKNYPLTNQYLGTHNDRQLSTLETHFINLKQLNLNTPKSFSLSLAYNGSEQIRFIPLGRKTTAKMTSDWIHPSFTGNFLPQDDTEKVTAGGFEANWNILQINRSFSQQFFKELPHLTAYSFGTKFIVPVDEYQKSDRATKYGFIVIILTFLVFFLIQTLSKISIHPFQYLMIGIALVMFYTLLIAISEHSNFFTAYLISGIAVILLISLYSKSILNNSKFPILIGSCLTLLYVFIYIIIQLENYALIAGSIALFLILSIVMFLSRKFDWQHG